MTKEFIRVGTAVPHVQVGNCHYNAERIIDNINKAYEEKAKIIIFPELSITGYTCGDLFAQTTLIREAESSILHVAEQTEHLDIISIIGAPVEANGKLMNAAVVIHKGKVMGIATKTFLPNYKEFYEKRWFAEAQKLREKTITYCKQRVSIGNRLLFATPHTTFGVEICEDVWAPIPPSSQLCLHGAEIIFNMSADNENLYKNRFLRTLLTQQSARTISAYVFSSCSISESTTDSVFVSAGYVYECGELLVATKHFATDEQIVIADVDLGRIRGARRQNTTFAHNQELIQNEEVTVIEITSQENEQHTELIRKVNPTPFIPSKENMYADCEEVLELQSTALYTRLKKININKVAIGISGGLDSTLALMVACRTMDKLNIDRKNIIAITMPGFGTTNRTYDNAIKLMNELGVDSREIDIKKACMQHFEDIGHNPDTHNNTYENVQARERTQILMDIANKENAIVLGTGDLSELALGWATYAGDLISMYSINGSVPKTLVKKLIKHLSENNENNTVREVLADIAATPITPELMPITNDGKTTQLTEDIVGPYILHDFFIYHFTVFGASPSKIFLLATNAFKGEFTNEEIKHWLVVFLKRFFTQQFKRSCMPDGPKVTPVSLSPRADWKMPSDASYKMWIDEAERIKIGR